MAEKLEASPENFSGGAEATFSESPLKKNPMFARSIVCKDTGMFTCRRRRNVRRCLSLMGDVEALTLRERKVV